MRLGVDVDLVVADSGKEWDKWILEKCSIKKSRVPNIDSNYDISSYYQKELNKIGLTGMEFWRQEDLYDFMPLVSGSKEALNLLSNRYSIVFISTVKGNHHKSKYEFLKRHFPYMRGFLATKEKELVNVHVMIDDRLYNLVNFPHKTKTILFGTPYKQNPEKEDNTFCKYLNKPKTWQEIVDDLL